MTISGFLALKSHQLQVVVVVTERCTLDRLISFPKQSGQILETNNLKDTVVYDSIGGLYINQT